jgi:hypothetical protein
MTQAILLYEAAKSLGCTGRNLALMAKRGKIPGAFKIGKHGLWRIPVEALEQITQNGPNTGK